jgi:hypothetical protein
MPKTKIALATVHAQIKQVASKDELANLATKAVKLDTLNRPILFLFWGRTWTDPEITNYPVYADGWLVISSKK